MKTEGTRLEAVDEYIAKAAPFAQPILNHIRDAMHKADPEVTEAIKWGHPFFVHRGIILGNMAAFKSHCALGLWGKETVRELRENGLLTGGAMGSFGRLTSADDLPPGKTLVSLIHHAVDLIDSGERTRSFPARKSAAKKEAPVPDELALALEENLPAAERFRAFSPGCRREYCEWIGEAKRPETRVSRAATAVQWIAQGKSRNWKYEAKR